jgi:4-hydroxyphenylpyruvate dioxygenase-like putative hemolysin
MSVHTRDRGGNTGVCGKPRTRKSNAAGQLERYEGKHTDHVDVWVPKSKLAPWIRFYKSIKASKPNQFVAFTRYERILPANNPVNTC